MKKVIIATKNPVKIYAARNGFKSIFPNEEFEFESVNLQIDLPKQPISEEEALKCSLLRAKKAMQDFPDADFFVGMNGGVHEKLHGMETFGYIVILSKEMFGIAKTGSVQVPDKVAKFVKEGMELGDANDLVFSRLNSKEYDGTPGILTGNVLNRKEYYEQAVLLALVPFKNPDYYNQSNLLSNLM